MNLFLCGQKTFGATVLRRLRSDGHTIAGVCCPVDASKDDAVYSAAKTFRIPVVSSGGLNANAMPSGVDLIVCAHSHDFVGAATRRKARFGAIGFHPSLLPRHRGRDAIKWTIKMRDAITGGTVYWLDDRMDAGPVAAQRWCFVNPTDDASSLWRHTLFPMGVDLLSSVVQDVARGIIVRHPQDESFATFEPACNPPPVRRPDLLGLPGPGVTFSGREYAVVGSDAGYPWKAEPL